MSKKASGSHVSRRYFLRQSAVIGALGAIEASGSVHAAQVEAPVELHPGVEKFKGLFGLDYSIVEAPIGGPDLTAAVAEAGALGGLGLSFGAEPPAERVKRVQSKTRRAFFVNYVLNFEPRQFDEVLDAGPAAVQFSFGMPSNAMASKMRAAEVKLGIQVTSRDSAKAALDLHADYLVCQGLQAGGHVQASRRLDDALDEVVDVAGDTPVIASGGIATGGDIRKVIQRGASGALLGTRFLATKESWARPDYQQALIDAKADDTVYTICLSGRDRARGWIANHRVLRGRTFNMWEAAGCPTYGARPGEDDVVARLPDGSEYTRYAAPPPFQFVSGELDDLAMYAGEGVGSIEDVPSARELIHRLWQELGGAA